MTTCFIVLKLWPFHTLMGVCIDTLSSAFLQLRILIYHDMIPRQPGPGTSSCFVTALHPKVPPRVPQG